MTIAVKKLLVTAALISVLVVSGCAPQEGAEVMIMKETPFIFKKT